VTLSIVVPVLNESEALPALTAQLATLRQDSVEVLLVDGGSHDHTASLAEGAGWRVIRSERGRARQMNAGAAHAGASILLFLHADTQLPPNAVPQILAALQGKHCWGRFDVVISGRPAMLKVVAWMMNWRSRWTGIATGDQAMFMTRQAYKRVGGFPDQPLMEDIEMSKRLKRLSRPACLRCKVTTSGRRWETRGVWRTIFLMWRLRWAYWCGQSATELARAYR
jgi:rSAM/selenodomain-associated transferase 2